MIEKASRIVTLALDPKTSKLHAKEVWKSLGINETSIGSSEMVFFFNSFLDTSKLKTADKNLLQEYISSLAQWNDAQLKAKVMKFDEQVIPKSIELKADPSVVKTWPSPATYARVWLIAFSICLTAATFIGATLNLKDRYRKVKTV
ncbi:MAG: hypothetical protein EOP04_22055 [Proteobacteria bacterium]|nr:MAG: hypothetical protein EOP04_22055 [Pseudomonadota bacterium]